MANFNNIKNEIDQNVNTNGQQAITGAILNETLKDMLDSVDTEKQDTLESGVNLKTINNQSLLGSGNIDISGGSGSYTAGEGISISGDEISVDFNDVQGKLTAGSHIDLTNDTISTTGLQDTLVSGVNIKTINNLSLLGSGDITISGGGGTDTFVQGTETNSIKRNDGNTYASGYASTAIGPGSEALGQNSLALGYNSHAIGSGSTSIGAGSRAEGVGSIAAGLSAVASGDNSAALGEGVLASNSNEISLGTYNKSTTSGTNAENTAFSIGNGTDSGWGGTTRRNRLEIKQNSDAYLVGVGGYDGTNDNVATTVQDTINAKQNTLVSGSNIRTVNGNSLLGSGDLTITATYSAGNGIDITGSTISVNASDLDGSGLTTNLNGELEVDTTTIQDKLVSGTNIKTVNGNSLLGSGDLVISGGGGTSYTAGEGIDITNDTISIDYSDFADEHLNFAGISIQDAANQGVSGMFINSPTNYNSSIEASSWDGVDNASSYIRISGVVGGSNKSTQYLSDGVDNGHKISFPTLSSDDTFAVASDLSGKQDTLVSGTSIKTVNGNSLLGSGDLVISGGGGTSYTAGNGIDITGSTISVDATDLDGSGLSVDASGALEVDTTAIQEKLVSGTNIKTVNGNSLLGSGDLTISVSGNYLPLSGGTISDPNSSTTTLMVQDNNNSSYITQMVDSGVAAPMLVLGGLLNGANREVLVGLEGFSPDSGSNWINFPSVSAPDTLAVLSDLSGKQDTLVSGTNIKTVNGNSLLGSGDITISGGQSYTAGSGLNLNGTTFSVDTTTIQEKLTAGSNVSISGSTISATDTTYSAGSGLSLTGTTFAADTSVLQEKLVSGTNIKTVNGNSLLGSGNIVISGGGGGNLWFSGTGSDSLMPIGTATDNVIDAEDPDIIHTSEASGYRAIATGYCTKATGSYSIAFGAYTTASGNESIASGGSIASGFASVALGESSQASGRASSAFNNGIAYGDYSFASGLGSIAQGNHSLAFSAGRANGNYSIALGEGCLANNTNSVALGVYNQTTDIGTDAQKTHFAVGNGSYGANNLLNVIETKKNNDVYIYGVGNFNGKDTSQANTLQTVISGKQDTLVSGTNIKTINGTSILGSGDITISGGGGNYLSLDGGTLKDTAVGATETLLDIVAPDTTGAISFSADTISAMIQMSADKDDASVSDGDTYGVNFDNFGDVDILVKTVNPSDPTDITTTTYSQIFQQKSGTIALLSDITGSSYTAGTGISISSGTITNTAPDPGLWVAGTGSGSIMTSTTSTSSGVASGARSINVGWGGTVSGTNSFAGGSNCTVSGNYSLAFGTSCSVSGVNSIAVGQGASITVGGFNAGNSAAFGAYSTTSGQYSFVAGNNATSTANNTISIGVGTRAGNQNEFSFGKFNKSTTSATTSDATFYTIGNGTADNSRSNLLEAKQNNDVYLVGVGGYDGTNAGASGVQTLQYVINNAGGGGGGSYLPLAGGTLEDASTSTSLVIQAPQAESTANITLEALGTGSSSISLTSESSIATDVEDFEINSDGSFTLNYVNGTNDTLTLPKGTGTLALHGDLPGNYNYTSADIVYSYGIGTSGTPLNAFAIDATGNIYVKGLGGYTGTDITGCTDLATFLNSL